MPKGGGHKNKRPASPGRGKSGGGGPASDTKLYGRIKEYAQQKHTSLGIPVDVDALVEHLQQAYPEYRHKKRDKLASYTAKMLTDIVENKERVMRARMASSDAAYIANSNVPMMVVPDSNAMNARLVSGYRNKPQKPQQQQQQVNPQQPVQASLVVTDIFDYPAAPILPTLSNTIDSSSTTIIPPTTPPLTSSSVTVTPLSPTMGLSFPQQQSTTDEVSNTQPSQHSTTITPVPTTAVARPPSAVTAKSEEEEEEEDNTTDTKKNLARSRDRSSPKKKTDKTPTKSSGLKKRKLAQSGSSSLSSSRARNNGRGANMGRWMRGGGGSDAGDGSGSGDGPAGGGGDDGFSMSPTPKTRYSDLGGVEPVLQIVREMIELPILHPELYRHLGISLSKGVLLHGPAGCGKTTLAHAIAGELGVPFFKIGATEVVSGMTGQSESKLRRLFTDAAAVAPAIIFIDEIDAIAPRRDSTEREMSRRIVAQFMNSMDELSADDENPPVIVIGATNRPDSLDPALRTATRFAKEIRLGIPNETAREKILTVLIAKLRISGDFNLRRIAHLTPGFAGADLAALTREAANIAVHRIFERIGTIGSITETATVIPIPAPVTQTLPTTILDPCLPSIGASSGMELDHTTSEMSTSDTTAATTITPMDESNTPQQQPQQPQQLQQSLDTVIDQNAGVSTVRKFETREDIHYAALAKRQETSERLRSQPKLTEEQLAPFFITMQDFVESIKKVQPSAKREGFATVPDVLWEDVGALKKLREDLNIAVLDPIRRPRLFEYYGLSSPAGVLLYGPPGCGKTLLAKAIANEGGFNFISVKGPELLNKYVGESERGVRAVFQRGQSSAPCIIFFDEIDALCPKRESDGTNNATQRVVNQLLTELDGVEGRKDVYIIAATNRPDIIDPAMLRPGRLDKLLYVPLPDPDERVDILKTVARNLPLHPLVDLVHLGRSAERYSGADLTALVREASMEAVKEAVTANPDLVDPLASGSTLFVTKEHFQIAFSKIRPSVSAADEQQYLKKAGLMAAKGKAETALPSNDHQNNNNNNTARPGWKLANRKKKQNDGQPRPTKRARTVSNTTAPASSASAAPAPAPTPAPTPTPTPLPTASPSAPTSTPTSTPTPTLTSASPSPSTPTATATAIGAPHPTQTIHSSDLSPHTC
eukprot:TRINITY_DN3879_c0_g1_i2.p1 TRINITY_DN3879_c0_g1~~TRINITY_DN3879_c0_g1_i2.p1  ORF type:complete len:1163 (+),score=263.08 TRINITY_DN3879_c0_g1_i2:75-3563(+)